MTWDILKQRQIEKLEMEREQLSDNLKYAGTTEAEDIMSDLEEIEIELKGEE